MLKIRIEGMKEEIYKYIDLIRNRADIQVLNISNCYANRGISVYHRAYVEIEINDSNGEEKNDN